ncbi:uncharacterized protein LOC122307291 [Carya illinoinensis]|uniref:Protein kinase domain-containing protein n=1 Tax=Carya illinoinensis TaxID=32201 RepID=A0A8T1QRX0_CARIL|nr:uncharacterized protein LOC122307291 [Carya illinoinensis]XP_042976003.1 uncharacterized protein LOC122307291 [Carya illinoinensis]XP_042976004.1 uncharacterized protein LOC122307291 [Carya illinoinensis]KAG6657678.1 hypothetical protein CIPAW_04G107100 [Carya illinoinensis]KAG6657679.1 hypothetical protein CIPAW_04G107100 [Carya illinoinensis]KAG6657680.1 hypothetical protein CIPAW_04G107100 [Carya illinoinensis]KAG6657681.1 hypothetical protein CIPAW_04G107100 [Carya illinoinensis]
MAGEAPGPSGQWIQKQPTLVIPNVGSNVNKNFSVRTGEEFSMEFLQDRAAARRVPNVPNMAHKREKKVLFNYDQNGHLVYEDLTGTLGLSRMDSESASDMSEYASAGGSVKELENGAYGHKSNKNHQEDRNNGQRSRKASGELNCNGTGSGPMSSPIYKSDSPHSNNFPGLGASDGSQSGKMKFLCSFGGKIFPRPSDGKLRYVGGETHIISIRKNITREELVKKTFGICSHPHTIKYQLPGEDLDALISVSSDEDLHNMIDEYNGLERHEGSQRLRIFLIPLGESEEISSLEGNAIQRSSPDYQYVVAVNEILDPSSRKNTCGQNFASDLHLRTNMDCYPSFYRNTPTALFQLERKDGFNDLHPSQYFNQPQNRSRSPDKSLPFSSIPLQGEDSRSANKQLCGDNPCQASNESSISFFSTQQPPEDSSSDSTGSKHPIKEAVPLMNHLHPYKQVNDSQPGGGYFHNHNPRKEFVLPALDHDEGEFDGFSCEKPMHKERIFHSEKPISHTEDPLGLFSGSGDYIDSHRGLPHAFSDSKLHENGGSSAFCSQEGISPLSPLNFLKPQLSPQLNSTVSQDKPLKPHEHDDLVYPHVQYKLVETVSQSRPDWLNSSTCPKISGRNEPNDTGNGSIDDKEQTAEKDSNNSGFMIPKKFEENFSTLERFGQNNPFLCLGGELYEERSPATGWGYKTILPDMNSNLSPFGIDTSMQVLQASGQVLPASSAVNFKPFVDNLMEHPQNHRLEKIPPESQRTANDEDCASTITVSGVEGKGISEIGNYEVAGLDPSVRQQYHNADSSTDLMTGSSCRLASLEPPLLKPVTSHKDMGIQEPIQRKSVDLCPSTAHARCGLSSNLNTHDDTMTQNPNKDALLQAEFSLLDENLVIYPDQKVDKSVGFAGPVNEKSNAKDQSLAETKPPSRTHDKNLQKPVIIVEDVLETNQAGVESSSGTAPCILDETSDDNINILSPTGTEEEGSMGSIVLEFEDAVADDEDKTESINDAMIAEMEASIYGLQIIKNADLEELRELGSGTYGTVYHGKWRGTDVAIKRIKKSCFSGRSSEQERLTRDFWREAQILSNLHHPNVVAFYGVVPDGTGGTLATVTEYMVNGSLRHVLLKKDRALDRRKKLIIAMDAAFGMEYLHSKNIVHFDLKCDNLLVNLRDPQRPICKVGDFGLSRIKRNTLVSGGVRGTLPWMAPELLNGSSSRVSEKVDVFSFGISMWEILTGEEPYENMHCGAIIGGIVKNTLRPPIPEHCDPEWRKLMEDCWSPDPETRPSFTEITNRLRSMAIVLQSKGSNNLVIRQGKPNILS